MGLSRPFRGHGQGSGCFGSPGFVASGRCHQPFRVSGHVADEVGDVDRAGERLLEGLHSPKKIAGIQGYGLEVVESVPLVSMSERG